MIRKLKKDESGLSLVETMTAVLIMLVGLLAMAQALTFGVIMSKTYGRDAGKATAAAKDKIEELYLMNYADLAPGGSIDKSQISDTGYAGYRDYVSSCGVKVTSASDAAFIRQWAITDETDSKKIAVAVTSSKSFKYGTLPATVLVTEKTP